MPLVFLELRVPCEVVLFSDEVYRRITSNFTCLQKWHFFFIVVVVVVIFFFYFTSLHQTHKHTFTRGQMYKWHPICIFYNRIALFIIQQNHNVMQCDICASATQIYLWMLANDFLHTNAFILNGLVESHNHTRLFFLAMMMRWGRQR